MRIAQINPGHMNIPPDSWGAVEKIIWYYKLELEKLGHEVSIKYINEINQNDFDIVHVHMWNHAIEMYEKKIPYVFTCHDHHTFIHGKDSDVYRNNLKAMKNSKLSIVPAKYLVEYFENVPVYLPHGIRTEEYEKNTPNEETRILCVGNNGILGDTSFDRKGFGYAIEAASKLNIRVTVAGPTKSNLDFFNTNSHLLKDNVHVKYDLSDNALKSLYSSHDILIHASSVEAGHPPLTLLEAAASGLPIISTDCGGDLYITPVNRNIEEITKAIEDVINQYDLHRKKTIESVLNFEWNSIVKQLSSLYEGCLTMDMKKSILGLYNKASKQNIPNYIKINFVDGPFVEVNGNHKQKYTVSFIDRSNDSVIFSTQIGNNQWCKSNRKWYTDWRVKIESESGEVFDYNFDLNGKSVLISFESSSLGDTLAWMPYVEEFRKKHNCHVIVSTFKNELFSEMYPELEFINPGSSVEGLYALYRLGWFYENEKPDYTKNKTDFTKISLQQTATDILGLDYTEIRPRIKSIQPMKSEKPYICIANHSTAQPKYWNNPTGWQELVNYVKELGYDVYLLSKEPDGYMGNKNPVGVIKVDGKSLEEIGSILLGSKGFVGLGSGLSWFSWALGVPTILISGFSEKYQEMSTGVYRIINESVCHGCFARHTFDKGDWNWCPDQKGTYRQFECTKTIGFDMIRPKIDMMLEI
jgi:autotransporter strand-loop-strand O-heptosyltransferase